MPVTEHCLQIQWLHEMLTSRGGIFIIAGVTGSAKASTAKDCVDYLRARGKDCVETPGFDSAYVAEAAAMAKAGVPVLLSVTADAPGKVRGMFLQCGRLDEFKLVRAVLFQWLERGPGNGMRKAMTWTRLTPNGQE